MATTQATVVGTSAVAIWSGGPNAVEGTQTVVISNAGATAVFLGPSTVSASGANTGVQLLAGTNLVLTDLLGSVSAISTGAGTTVVVGVF